VAVVLTNLAQQAADVSLDLGSQSGQLRPKDRFGGSFQPLPSLDYAGQPLDLSLPAQSVTTLIVQRD
jgi:hypothetical protein